MKNLSTKRLCRSGVIAGLYVALTFVVLPVASGAIQFRPSEALTLLPLFFPESIPALFIGCLLANLISGCALPDIFLGSLVTLVSATLTFFAGRFIKNNVLKVFVGGIFPILLNALLLPLIWFYAYGANENIYILQVAFLLISQTAVIYGLGFPLYFGILNLKNKNVSFFKDYNDSFINSKKSDKLNEEKENLQENDTFEKTNNSAEDKNDFTLSVKTDIAYDDHLSNGEYKAPSDGKNNATFYGENNSTSRGKINPKN